MRKIFFLSVAVVFFFSAEVMAQSNNHSKESSLITVGEDFSAENVLSASQVGERYSNLKPGDTLNVSFTAEVASVCKKKGCWMNLSLEEGKEVMVKFKDYAFFVPRDIESKKVIVSGKAYVTEMSVEDRQHYAQDAGKTAEEIKSITEPAKTLSFIAEGVKIQK